MLTVGSLCTGTGQLERALQLAGADTELAFVADPDPAATRLLAHHHPHVPNLGDITRTDWTRVPTVDVLCAGWPCQPWSLAGKRKGADDERAIWPAVANAVRDLRPRYVFLENVPGAISAGELGRALGHLASFGYVGSWRCVRASDVGAAHKRERLFILAWQTGDSPAGLGLPAAGPGRRGGDGAVLSLLPTPRTSDTNGAGVHGSGGMDLRTAVTLLPTPMAADGDRTSLTMSRGNPTLVGALLPTPRATDGTKGGPNQRGSSGDLMLPSAVMLLPTPTASHDGRNATANRRAPKPTTATTGWTLNDIAYADRWGEFGPAITQWEAVMGRPAPDPTEPGRNGQPRLASRFVEWLMGHLDGYVTGVPGLTRNQILALCGNGVVALQGAYAARLLAAS